MSLSKKRLSHDKDTINLSACDPYNNSTDLIPIGFLGAPFK